MDFVVNISFFFQLLQLHTLMVVSSAIFGKICRIYLYTNTKNTFFPIVKRINKFRAWDIREEHFVMCITTSSIYRVRKKSVCPEL